MHRRSLFLSPLSPLSSFSSFSLPRHRHLSFLHPTPPPSPLPKSPHSLNTQPIPLSPVPRQQQQQGDQGQEGRGRRGRRARWAAAVGALTVAAVLLLTPSLSLTTVALDDETESVRQELLALRLAEPHLFHPPPSTTHPSSSHTVFLRLLHLQRLISSPATAAADLAQAEQERSQLRNSTDQRAAVHPADLVWIALCNEEEEGVESVSVYCDALGRLVDVDPLDDEPPAGPPFTTLAALPLTPIGVIVSKVLFVGTTVWELDRLVTISKKQTHGLVPTTQAQAGEAGEHDGDDGCLLVRAVYRKTDGEGDGTNVPDEPAVLDRLSVEVRLDDAPCSPAKPLVLPLPPPHTPGVMSTKQEDVSDPCTFSPACDRSSPLPPRAVRSLFLGLAGEQFVLDFNRVETTGRSVRMRWTREARPPSTHRSDSTTTGWALASVGRDEREEAARGTRADRLVASPTLATALPPPHEDAAPLSRDDIQAIVNSPIVAAFVGLHVGDAAAAPDSDDVATLAAALGVREPCDTRQQVLDAFSTKLWQEGQRA